MSTLQTHGGVETSSLGLNLSSTGPKEANTHDGVEGKALQTTQQRTEVQAVKTTLRRGGSQQPQEERRR